MFIVVLLSNNANLADCVIQSNRRGKQGETQHATVEEAKKAAESYAAAYKGNQAYSYSIHIFDVSKSETHGDVAPVPSLTWS